MRVQSLGALAWLALPGSAPSAAQASVQEASESRAGLGRPWIWISPDEIRKLPMNGPAWDARPAEKRGVYYYAQQSTAAPNIANQDDNTDVFVLAKALVYLRLRQDSSPLEDPETYRSEVQTACLAARGTENGVGATTLSLGRNLLGYVLAANLIDWNDWAPGQREADFRSWLSGVRTEPFQEGLITRTLVSAHENRPNNWGLMCGASRLAADIYLGDVAGENRGWSVFRRWLGDATSPFDFDATDWGGPNPPDLTWHLDAGSPVGINPRGSSKVDGRGIGRSIDGVLPDEMRRAGSFRTALPASPHPHVSITWLWPVYPQSPDRDYNWEAMQAVLAQAVMHGRRGKDPWSLSDSAIRRAFLWLYGELRFPVTDAQAGDDSYWLPHVANQVYGLGLAEPPTTKPGRQTGFGDWTTLDSRWP